MSKEQSHQNAHCILLVQLQIWPVDEGDKKIKKKGNYIAFYVYSSTHSAIRFEIESLIYVLCRCKVWLI